VRPCGEAVDSKYSQAQAALKSAMVRCESAGLALDAACRAPHNHNRTARRRSDGGHMGNPGENGGGVRDDAA